ncbi:MAG TPA: hypothetical protein VN611_08075 [Patescibacteria group bacterium]|nr:hypothetical protein [Patescibacteria group bacterium]
MLSQNPVRKFVTNIGDGQETEFEIVHGLETKDVIVTMFHNETGEEIFTGCTVTGDNSVKVACQEPPANAIFRVVIIG